MAVDTLEVPAEAISFQSSNAWDAAGASAFGFKVAWVNRFGQVEERIPDPPHAELDNLTPLPAMVT
jgi:2-haloacid dehalogenase